MKELAIDYSFSENENSALVSALLSAQSNPYFEYAKFQNEILNLIQTDERISTEFKNFCAARKYSSLYEDPYVLIRNCPIDPYLPDLDLDSPVIDKRTRKNSYVAEGFLLLYAHLMDQQPIGYANVNDGDVFQDIHPMRSMMDTQSQKASKSIYFHKDLANHFVRPDWVNILGLRASPKNEIYTSFVRNKDLISALSPEMLELLRKPLFNTPYDDLTLASSNVKLGEAPNHPVLGGAEVYDIRFFENRTKGVTPEAQGAVDEIVSQLHALKKRLLILPGDFIGSANNECIHNKEVVHIGDESAIYNRWLMKTVNVRSLDSHKQHMRTGEVRIVNG